jgi:PadR family transcriptional regulator PadR
VTHLDLVLLGALAQGPAHGYALIEEIRRRTDGTFNLAEGTAYPALYRLERSGLLASSWKTVDGRRRRIYRLTRRGRRALEREKQEWGSLVRAVQAVVGT